MSFPDLTHLKQLQADLWRWPRARASVMVGAGFSLNAEPLAGVSRQFPSWSELTKAMFDELHPINPKDTAENIKQRSERFLRSNPLRLASEYEAAFGRLKLDQLIRRAVPDSDYQPGKLHKLLLQLPWADVFTTNYDTLLERTEIHGRSYQPITKASELTNGFSPRIVKLHGSFPSQTPFICSEEDYRTYPRKYAPFINTVQQSLLENTFVLVGFSGEDPNFLEWTGWIRDELEGKHSPIYLVGPLNLGNAARALLLQRGVTPIDLAPLFPDHTASSGLHSASAEWFLRYLVAARPPRPEQWPRLEREPISEDQSLPDLSPFEEATPAPVNTMHLAHGPIDKAVAAEVETRWRFEREMYPGWVVAPEDIRRTIWFETNSWIGPLLDVSKGWSSGERVRLYREINWRLSTGMVPLFTETRATFEKTVVEVFKGTEQQNPSAQPSSLSTRCRFENQELADGWFELSFALMREAREDYDSTLWSSISKMVDEALLTHPNHSDRRVYEGALWAAWNGERSLVKDILARWQPGAGSPLPLMWKAGLLAELDEVGESETLLRIALGAIQKSLRSVGQDIGLLSLDGWCSYLLYVTEPFVLRKESRDLHERFRERWQELQASDSSPWQIMEQLKSKFAVPHQAPQKSEERIQGFDPGHYTIHRRFGGDGITPYLPGFALIRLYEQVGIPMRLRHVNISGETLVNACRLIAPLTGFWSPALLIRAGEVKAFREQELLRRTRVAVMDSVLATRIYGWCLEILRRELISITTQHELESAQESLLNSVTEVLSRLAFKASQEELKATFPLALRLHGHPGVRSNRNLHELCDPWFERLFNAASRETLLEWLPDLIRSPLIDDQVHQSLQKTSAWPDPMRSFPFERNWEGKSLTPEINSRIQEATWWLIKRASCENGEAKVRALLRLIHVHQTKIMSPQQEDQFCQLLWSERNQSNLPALPGLLVHSFLHLPVPADLDVAAVIKQRVMNRTKEGSSPDSGSRQVIIYSGPWQTWIQEAESVSAPQISIWGGRSKGVDWSIEESRQLYLDAFGLWNQHKGTLSRPREDQDADLMPDSISSGFKSLGRFLANVVVPRMEWANDEDWLQLEQWMQEARTIGFFPSVALPYCLIHRPLKAQEFGETLEHDMHSRSGESVKASAEAILHWHILHSDGRVPEPPPSLLKSLLERCLFRSKEGLPSCLTWLSWLIRRRPEKLSSTQGALLCDSLDQWANVTALRVDEGDFGEFPEVDLPSYRAQIGYLAGALTHWATTMQPELPEHPGISMWRELCASDPLPEVQRSFLEGSN